jgi:predicted dinucleotide-binding enzyme
LGGEASRGKSRVEEIQMLLPDSKVVHTFSIEFAADFARAVAGGHSLDAFFMNNDLQALQQ